MFAQPIVAVGIDDQKLRSRIANAIGQFGAGPPGVERHRDRPDRRDREKDHRPFGQVAYCEGDTVALPDAHAPKRPRESGGSEIIGFVGRSEEHTSELQSLIRISYSVFCLKKKKKQKY